MNDVTPGFSFNVIKLVVDNRMNIVTMSYGGVSFGICVKQRRA